MEKVKFTGAGTDIASSPVQMGGAWTRESWGGTTCYIKNTPEHATVSPCAKMQGPAGADTLGTSAHLRRYWSVYFISETPWSLCQPSSMSDFPRI